MKVQEHSFAAGICIWCGAKDLPTLLAMAKSLGIHGEAPPPEQRSCIEREDYAGKLCPEPQRRQYACEDFDAILGRVNQIKEEAQPRCPITSNPLYGCLRAAAKCGDNCPHRDAWIGPEISPAEQETG